MTRHLGVIFRTALALLLGFAAGVPVVARAQYPYDDRSLPPPTPAPYHPALTPVTPGTSDLPSIAGQLAAAVRLLSDDVANDFGATAQDPFLRGDLDRLAHAVDAFRTRLSPGFDRDLDRLAAAFDPIDATWQRLDGRLVERNASRQVMRSARRVGQINAMLQQALGLLGPMPEPLPDTPIHRRAFRPVFNPVAEVIPLSGRLAQEADQFVQRFIATTSKVPEGAGFIADITRLRDAAFALSQDARAGLPLEQLLARAEQLDQSWIVLKIRLDRVASGRPIGPNIADLLNMGNTVAQINSLLDPRASPAAATSLPPPYAGPLGMPRRFDD